MPAALNFYLFLKILNDLEMNFFQKRKFIQDFKFKPYLNLVEDISFQDTLLKFSDQIELVLKRTVFFLINVLFKGFHCW